MTASSRPSGRPSCEGTGRWGADSIALEDRWLGHSPGGWEGGEGSHGSLWGWVCRACVTQGLEGPLPLSFAREGGDIGLRAKLWSWQSTCSPRPVAPWGRAQPARSPQSELGSALALAVDRDTVVWARTYVPELGTSTHPSTPTHACFYCTRQQP